MLVCILVHYKRLPLKVTPPAACCHRWHGFHLQLVFLWVLMFQLFEWPGHDDVTLAHAYGSHNRGTVFSMDGKLEYSAYWEHSVHASVICARCIYLPIGTHLRDVHCTYNLILGLPVDTNWKEVFTTTLNDTLLEVFEVKYNIEREGWRLLTLLAPYTVYVGLSIYKYLHI